jgi:hypothetical protein
VYKILVGKPERTRPLLRPTQTWEGNVRIDRNEVGCEDAN